MTLKYSYGIFIELKSISAEDQKRIDNALSNISNNTVTLLNQNGVNVISISRTIDEWLFEAEMANIEKDIRQQARKFATTISETFLSQVQNAPIVIQPVSLK